MYVCIMYVPYVSSIFIIVRPIVEQSFELREQGILLRAEEILRYLQQLVPSVHVCMYVCILSRTYHDNELPRQHALTEQVEALHKLRPQLLRCGGQHVFHLCRYVCMYV